MRNSNKSLFFSLIHLHFLRLFVAIQITITIVAETPMEEFIPPLEKGIDKAYWLKTGWYESKKMSGLSFCIMTRNEIKDTQRSVQVFSREIETAEHRGLYG